ncbi:MAG TPA: KEOPS complex kinase/ATPase Bud32 [Patescibacteria group bacterium]|nr:KEOPS complex kinase/ATPase Bud32 [Patescibacteria group bacterium]
MDEVNSPLLIKKGAEANLYLADWHGRRVVLKKRLPKEYRPVKLDEQIRTYRTVHESQLMHDAKEAGVPTPKIFLIDVKNTTIIMEFIEGKQIKLVLNDLSEIERRNLCFGIGQLIAKLHKKGVIHGDLTTSNMIMNAHGKVFFVDFGLGEKSEELEARGVDLHLMKRALESTHYQFAESCYKSVIDGYGSLLSSKELQNILEKIKEIERRGRYVSERRPQVSA